MGLRVVAKNAGVSNDAMNTENYKGTSIIRNGPLLGPYSRAMLRILWWS